jgi:hypothetical protein
MPRKNCEAEVTPIERVFGDHGCPKCGVAMEPIDIGVEGLPLEQLQLCPACYLVTWNDENGLHARQGVPVKKGVSPHREPKLPIGEPDEC